MGFDTGSEGEILPQLGIDDAGDLFTGAGVLADAALGEWADEEAESDLSAARVMAISDDPGNKEDFLDDTKSADSRVREHRLLLAGLAFSLVLHFSLGGALVSFEPVEQPSNSPDVVSIRLLPANPLREDSPAPQDLVVEEPVPEEVEEVLELLAEEAPAEAVDATEPLPEEPVETGIVQSEATLPQPDMSEPQPAVVPPVIVIPNTDLVTRSIQSVESEKTSRLWAYDCNAQQEESDFIRCDEQATPDYDRVRENSTYRSLNPVRVLSRSQRTLPTVAENSAALAGRLQDIQIPEGLSEYLMEEVEAGITHNTNAGNRTLENIELMTDKSDAAKIARDVLGDPWIKTQSRNNAQHRVVPH